MYKMQINCHFFRKGIIDDLSVFGSGVDQRCRGDIVDKSWDAAGIVVDEGFGIVIEGFVGAAGQMDTMVDIGGGLIFGKGKQSATDGDAIDDVGMGGLFEGDGQGLLSTEDEFKGELGIDAGA